VTFDTVRKGLDPATLAVALGRGAGAPGDPVNAPLVLTSTYRAGGPLAYSRFGNSTWTAFEEVLGGLEGGECLAFASGLAAAAAIIDALPAGAAVVMTGDAYHGTRGLAADLAALDRIEVRAVDVADADATVAACAGAALVWIETPTNPMLAIADIGAIAAGAHASGTRVVVDNTFATPLLQRPLDLGADVVVHSATKFLAGHSDVVLGAVVARDADVVAGFRRQRDLHGAIPGPFETFLALRGIRTLAVRMERAQASAAVLAHRLTTHPAVARVRYPGLADHPQHDLAARQMRGFGAVVSFEVRGGSDAGDVADALEKAVRLIVPATSLGGVETLIEHRAKWPGEVAPPGLLRLSVGLEAVDDLWNDLDGALREVR
jgi:cystathionine gamma-synthase